jgi:hypothetical protein
LFNDFEPFVDPDKVRPFVYADERTVALHFDISAIQSRMRRDDPYRLDLDYTRAMMGFLLFRPDPRSILAIGLGGGSLPKYCYRHLPSADITVVEIRAQSQGASDALVSHPQRLLVHGRQAFPSTLEIRGTHPKARRLDPGGA